MFKYETHMHTSPVSRCARVSVRDTLLYYKKAGYDGVFITNHFLDGNVNIDRDRPYDEKINFYFSDYEEGVKVGEEIGLKVFPGVEISYRGTDFLIYGLDKEWYLAHPEIMEMDKKSELAFMAENGAFVVHAHPYREDSYIDHIRLYPRSVEAVEVFNACRRDGENELADAYADHYGLLKTAGSDNHIGEGLRRYGGMMSEEPLNSVQDYIDAVRGGKMQIFIDVKEEA